MVNPVSETRGIAHREGTYSRSVSELQQSTHRGIPNGHPVRETRGIAHREGTYSHSVSVWRQSTHRGIPNGSPVSETRGIAHQNEEKEMRIAQMI